MMKSETTDEKQKNEIQESLSKKPLYSKEPSLKLWGELYEAAIGIQKMKPWEYLSDSDLITIRLPGYEEDAYCSIMGEIKECYAIAVYLGKEGINSFYSLNYAEEEMALLTGLEQKCLVCYYGDREELSSKERKILKQLDLKFRGRNNWIFFKTMEPGFFPWYINAEQAEVLNQVLRNLQIALEAYIMDNLSVDFNNGKTLLRFYSPEKNEWINCEDELPEYVPIVPKITVDNDMLMAKLKKRKKNLSQLEFETFYLPAPVQGSEYERPLIFRIFLLADKNTELPIAQKVQDTGETIEELIIKLLSEYVEKFGRPASINVRDDRSEGYIGDFCKKANIKLIKGKGVPVIDLLIESMLMFME